MNEPFFVCVLQANGDLPYRFASLANGHRTRIANPLGQIDPIHEFHRVIVISFGHFCIEGENDIRMIELTGNPYFLPKASHRFGVFQLLPAN